jgi:hypothetical protein
VPIHYEDNRPFGRKESESSAIRDVEIVEQDHADEIFGAYLIEQGGRSSAELGARDLD